MAPLVIKYSYRDVATIEEFSNSNARIRGIVGPFRSGKSSGSVVEIVNRGLEQRAGPDGVARTRFIVVRNTFQQLEDSTIKTVHMWLPPHHFGKYHGTDHNYTVKALTNFQGAPAEIEIWFRALDRPDHVRNLLSVEVTAGWVNEAREVPWAIIEALDGRIGQYPPKFMGGPTWAGLWMDTNPPDTDSKWYSFFEEQKHDPARVQIFHQPSGLSDEAENLSNLPSPTYYTDLAYGKSKEWIKVYVEGLYGFVAEGKLVYPEYNDKFHCRSDIDPVPGRKIIRSWDGGLTPACVFSQELPTGQWLVFDEMTSSSMSLDVFSDEVLAHCARAFRGGAQFEDWGDPAMGGRGEAHGDSSFDVLRAKDIEINPSVTQDPALRQEAVRKPMRGHMGGEPMFIIHPRCKVLRKGFLGGYHRRRMQVSGPERYSEQPDKGIYSHPHDALQYGMAPYFVPILLKNESEDEYPSSLGYGDDGTGRNPQTGY